MYFSMVTLFSLLMRITSSEAGTTLRFLMDFVSAHTLDSTIVMKEFESGDVQTIT